MKKDITLNEWLEIAGKVISAVALSVKDDGKITLQEALSLMALSITEIINAFNN